jgi:hypothetical protein
MTKTTKGATKAAPTPKPATKPDPSKLDLLLAQLARAERATIDELAAATGWQKHSVRGAMAGTLKRKGHQIASTKIDGVRRYRLVTAA